MTVNERFLEHATDLLSGIDGLRVRKMFGGAGLFVEDTMFGLVYGSDLFLRTDDMIEVDFIDRGMNRFNPYPDRPMKMPYFAVPSEIIEDRDELRRWSIRSLESARKARSR